ncbi:MAG: 3-phosphoshikimate 1-carboxyvinyltransferase [Oscillospiraceae bacterium]|nr:3-phosphoshikimate 1-carboxyvinyltransferase [Oscillospiraceae bacterium]
MIKTVRRFPEGIVQIPPSKSILHRAIICDALAGGRDFPSGVSEDIDATARCALALTSGEPNITLDCGESGSTLRFTLPLAPALGIKKAVFRGRGRLLRRPMDAYTDELRRHGARIEEKRDELIVSGELEAGVYELPGDISSQYISGLLFALPLCGDSELRLTTPLESAGYVELTIDELQKSGVEIGRGRDAFYIRGGQKYARREISAEGDYSQAAFFLAAGALGCDVECRGLDLRSKQGDMEILDILKRCGIRVVVTSGGGIKAKPGKILPCELDASGVPDLVPPVAAMLSFASGVSRIYNAGRLRHKESDRLESVRDTLCALGARVVIDGDTLVINGRDMLEGGEISAHGDHRIAMMCAVAAIRCRWDVRVDGAECVAKSYPNFWSDFEAGAQGAE